MGRSTQRPNTPLGRAASHRASGKPSAPQSRAARKAVQIDRQSASVMADPNTDEGRSTLPLGAIEEVCCQARESGGLNPNVDHTPSLLSACLRRRSPWGLPSMTVAQIPGRWCAGSEMNPNRNAGLPKTSVRYTTAASTSPSSNRLSVARADKSCAAVCRPISSCNHVGRVRSHAAAYRPAGTSRAAIAQRAP